MVIKKKFQSYGAVNTNPMMGLKEQDGRICFAFLSTLQILKPTLPLAKKHCLGGKTVTCVSTNTGRLQSSQRQKVPHNV